MHERTYRRASSETYDVACHPLGICQEDTRFGGKDFDGHLAILAQRREHARHERVHGGEIQPLVFTTKNIRCENEREAESVRDICHGVSLALLIQDLPLLRPHPPHLPLLAHRAKVPVTPTIVQMESQAHVPAGHRDLGHAGLVAVRVRLVERRQQSRVKPVEGSLE